MKERIGRERVTSSPQNAPHEGQSQSHGRLLWNLWLRKTSLICQWVCMPGGLSHKQFLEKSVLLGANLSHAASWANSLRCLTRWLQSEMDWCSETIAAFIGRTHTGRSSTSWDAMLKKRPLCTASDKELLCIGNPLLILPVQKVPGFETYVSQCTVAAYWKSCNNLCM